MVPQCISRREEIKSRNSDCNGCQIQRPTWFEDETAAKTSAEPMHGRRLVIKEASRPSNHPRFEALEEWPSVASLCPKYGTAIVRMSALRPLSGTIIEQNEDGCLEDSLMPVGCHFTEEARTCEA